MQRQNNSSTILFHEAKQALPYIKQNHQATCLYVTVEFAILWSQGGVGVEYFYDLQRRSGCRSKLFGGGADRVKKMRLHPSLVASPKIWGVMAPRLPWLSMTRVALVQ